MFNKVWRVNWGQLEEEYSGLEGWTDNCWGESLCKLWEISISSNQYSKSKTARVKESYSSSLKKKINPFYFPVQQTTREIICGSMSLRLLKSLCFLGPYIIPIAPLDSSHALFSLKIRKANKAEPSVTQFSSLLQVSTSLHTELWPWELLFWYMSIFL